MDLSIFHLISDLILTTTLKSTITISLFRQGRKVKLAQGHTDSNSWDQDYKLNSLILRHTTLVAVQIYFMWDNIIHFKYENNPGYLYYGTGGNIFVHYKKKTGSFEDCSHCCLQLYTLLRWVWTWLPRSTSEGSVSNFRMPRPYPQGKWFPRHWVGQKILSRSGP